MRAVDTNIVARCLIDIDTVDQCRVARELAADGDILVPTTVLLETEWLLRRMYKIPEVDLQLAISSFLALPTVIPEEPRKVARALVWLTKGLDFADALHLASSDDCTDFVTFDRPLVRAAAKATAFPVTLLQETPA